MNSVLLSAALLAVTQVACAAATTNTTTTNSAQAAASSKGGGFVEERLKFNVTGMHCGACANAIKAELEKTPGVAEAQVDFKTGVVTVISSGPSKLDEKAVVKAIESSGTFKVKK